MYTNATFVRVFKTGLLVDSAQYSAAFMLFIFLGYHAYCMILELKNVFSERIPTQLHMTNS